MHMLLNLYSLGEFFPGFLFKEWIKTYRLKKVRIYNFMAFVRDYDDKLWLCPADVIHG